MTASLLRVATVGSVDDGKSTLIGRLLHDTASAADDELDAVEAASRRRGQPLDLSWLTDGLRAEREQGITIDVAYRYFATRRRSFVLADTPGHAQYTRNMVTGASTADVAVVLVDVRHGMTEQSRRHAVMAGLLRVPHLLLAINKVDLVGFDRAEFARVAEEFAEFAGRLGFADILAVPVSALNGDNVVARSEHTPWYTGPTVLEHLERVETAYQWSSGGARLPVQYVVRSAREDYRAYAGRLTGGRLSVGDTVRVMPSGQQTTVAALDTFGGELPVVLPGQSIAVRLAEELDVGRGDLLATGDTGAQPAQELDAAVCWLAEAPLEAGARYLLKHTTRMTPAVMDRVEGALDVTSAQLVDAERLVLNDIGRVHVRVATPLVVDPYADNRSTGSFVLIDQHSGNTVGAGMIGPPRWGWVR